MPTSGRNVWFDHGDNRPKQYANVHRNRPAMCVEAVERNLLGQDPVDVIGDRVILSKDLDLVGKCQLRQPRYPRFEDQDRLELGTAFDEPWILRTRTDQTHLPGDDIPELR